MKHEFVGTIQFNIHSQKSEKFHEGELTRFKEELKTFLKEYGFYLHGESYDIDRGPNNVKVSVTKYIPGKLHKKL